MTIINPNSIAGITSVTAEAGVMNFYKSDGTLAGLQLNGVNFNTTSGISTFSNLYVGGVLTYEDVKNVDSIGIVTAREGVVIPDTKELKFGSSAELKISNNGNAGYIQHSGSGYLFIHGNDIALRSTSQKNYIVCDSDQEVTLYYNNSPKFETTSGGINVTGKAIIDAVDVTELSNGATNNGIFLNAGDTGAGNRPYLDIKGAGTSALSGKALRVYYDNGGTESFYVDYEGNVSGKSVTIADKIIHAGDTNTFMEFDTDTITFDTAGSERVLISSTGLIWAKTRSAEVRRMILSGSPSNASFNIEAHDGESGTSSGDVQGKLGLFYNDGSTLTNTACISFERGSSAADGAMAFVTNQAERLRITSDGDMGLGANNPGADPAIGNDATVFEIRQTTTGNITSGNNRKGAVLRLKHEAQWENGYQSNNPNDDLGRVEFVTGDNSTGEGVRAVIRCRNLQYYNQHDLTFETVGPTGTSLTEKLRIHSTGQLELKVPDANPALKITPSGTNAPAAIDFNTPGTGSAVFKVQGSEKARITSAGSIAAGTVGGTYSLELENKVSNDVILSLKNSTTNEDCGIRITGAHSGVGNRTSKIGHSIVTSGTGLQLHSPDNIVFYTGSTATERFRIDDNGVKFQGNTAAANALSDYEEGTWTPSCRIETRAASDSPTDNVEGCYTKVGRVVTCHGKFTLNGTPSERSTNRAIELHGFPFDHNHDWDKVSGDIRVTGHDISSTFGQDIYFVMRMISGSQYCRIELVEQSYNGTRNASPVMQDNMHVIFSFTYVTV